MLKAQYSITHILTRAFLFAIILAGCQPATPPETPPIVEVVTQPGANYIGDASCAGCHEAIADTYSQTHHKTGFASFDADTAPESFDGITRVVDERRNLIYDVFLEGDSLKQRETRTDLNGEVIHELVYAADFVIGSGNATRSYLMQKNGFLTEMPVTWYVEKGIWDLSPGYRDANDRFSRKIILDCVTCHNGIPEHSPGTQNHYTDIPLGISCERCHGPASAHVAFWSAPESDRESDRDPLINLSERTRGEQLSNCQQCHLAGVPVYKLGEDATTFHSGQELAENRTVYVPEQHLVDPNWVGIDSHPLRLARSACYQATEMTCSTCHDPHRSRDQLPADFYNQKCQSCHNGETDTVTHTCSRPDIPVQQAVTGDCVSCHMQKGGTSDVPHVSFSDHWIRRDPGPPLDATNARSVFDTTEPVTLAGLQEIGKSGHLLDKKEEDEPAEYLEKAIAYFNFYEQMHSLADYLPVVIENAHQGLAGGADHPEARIALARSQAATDSMRSAIQTLQDAVVRYPNDPWVQFWLGSFLTEEGRTDAGIGALQRAVSIQPYFMEAQVKLADAYVKAGWEEDAMRQLERVVALDPHHSPRSAYNLGLLLARQKLNTRAIQAFERAVKADPDLLDAHIQLGSLYLGNGRLVEAERSFRNAIEVDENNPTGYGSLALVYAQRGDVERARQLLQTVLRLDPGNQAARVVLERLGN